MATLMSLLTKPRETGVLLPRFVTSRWTARLRFSTCKNRHEKRGGSHKRRNGSSQPFWSAQRAQPTFLARMAPFRSPLPCTSMLSCLPPQPPRNAPPATAPIAATTAHCWHGGYKQQHRGNATSGCRNAASATTRELTQPSPSLSSFLASLSSFLASLSSADDCESTTIHSFRAMFQPSGHVDA